MTIQKAETGRSETTPFKTALSSIAIFSPEILRHPSLVVNLVSRNGPPIAASIDVTPNCNLRCSHCYLYGKPYQEEGTPDADFLKMVSDFKARCPTLLHCTWVGGEPMLRKKTLREAVKFFPKNWVVTNGTIPIDGDWGNTKFNISIDGTEEVHNSIRRPWKPDSVRPGSPLDNVYQTAKKTASQATADVFIHTVINQRNLPTIPDLVAEWHGDGIVKGFAFSLHTPMVDSQRLSGMSQEDEGLYLSDGQRVAATKMLHVLKDRFGGFINMSDSMIDNYLPERQLRVWGERCRITTAVQSVDTRFQRKLPCVMGPGMDCKRCGCIVPSLAERALSLDLKAMAAVLPSIS